MRKIATKFDRILLAIQLSATLIAFPASSLANQERYRTLEVGMIYKFAGSSGNGYLMPSAHGGGQLPVSLRPSVKELISTVDVVAFESAPDAKFRAKDEQARMLVIMMQHTRSNRDGESISPELRARIVKLFDKAGVPQSNLVAFDRVKLTFAPDVLTDLVGQHDQQSKIDLVDGLDSLVLKAAMDSNRKIAEIEGVPNALVARLAISHEEAHAALERAVQRLEAGETRQSAFLRANEQLSLLYSEKLELLYKSHREHSCNTDLLARWCDKAFDARNQHIARRIHRLAESGQTALTVVGATHLSGPKSLIRELEELGYSVTLHISNSK
jgi:uncharacterized protein YbaP (TraB family)